MASAVHSREAAEPTTEHDRVQRRCATHLHVGMSSPIMNVSPNKHGAVSISLPPCKPSCKHCTQCTHANHYAIHKKPLALHTNAILVFSLGLPQDVMSPSMLTCEHVCVSVCVCPPACSLPAPYPPPAASSSAQAPPLNTSPDLKTHTHTHTKRYTYGHCALPVRCVP